MISGAEAHRIGRALESVAGWTSEIIVVLNQEVNDGTEGICRRYDAKVFREAWKGYGPQKNSAAAKSVQKWLLNLDADEEVTPELRAEIQDTIREPGRYAAFCFPRLTQFCGRWIRHGDWYPDRKIRLWQKGLANWSDSQVHESLRVNGSVGRLQAELRHYSMETLDDQVRKAVAYADIFARECEAQQRRIGLANVVLRPCWRFLRAYFLKLGFLDGRQGYVIAKMTAFYTFLRYLKAHEATSRRQVP